MLFFCNIFVIETNYEHRNVIRTRTIYRLDKFTSDIWQIELEVVFVRLFEVTYKRFERNVFTIIITIGAEIRNLDKGLFIYVVSLTHLLDRLVAKSQ